MNKIELIKLTNNIDNYQLLHKWCSNKNVYEWFEQRILSLDEIITKYINKIINNKQDLFFIKYNNIKIGFVQIYKCNKKIGNYKNIYEYDIFIGDEEYLSKGIGTTVVDYIDNYIFNKYNADSILLRPFKRNERAVKCYLNNGYKIIDEYEDVNTIGKKEIYVDMLKIMMDES